MFELQQAGSSNGKKDEELFIKGFFYQSVIWIKMVHTTFDIIACPVVKSMFRIKCQLSSEGFLEKW